MSEFIRAVLTSQGLYNSEIAAACAELVGKQLRNTSVAIMDLGSAAEAGDKGWVDQSKAEAREHFRGGAVEVDPTEQPIDEVERRILDSDVLFMLGGNCNYQVLQARRTGLARILPRVMSRVVCVTVSGSSMAMGEGLRGEVYSAGYADVGPRDSYDELPFFGVVKAGLMPHLGTSWAPGVTTELLDSCAGDYDFPIYGYADDSALVIKGTTARWVGTSPRYVVPVGLSPGDTGHFEY